MIDFSKIRTYSAFQRRNLVTLSDLIAPDADSPCTVTNPDFLELARRIAAARRNGRPVILSMGAHVIKNGLSLCLIELMKRGYVTHIAGNGASSIHDFELAYLGGTSEDVPRAIEDGSFGMWEETGRWMNEAIQAGAKLGLGYGEAIGRYIGERPERFPHRDVCAAYSAYRLGVPATYHIAIGTDIIHQHPIADFAAIGAATGEDWRGRIMLSAVTVKFDAESEADDLLRTSAERTPKRTRSAAVQTADADQLVLPLEPVSKGVMERGAQVKWGNEDLDIPTFKRRNIVIDNGKRGGSRD